MNHSIHNIISYGANATRYCPECNADWRGNKIPEEHRHHYVPTDGYFSRLIGIEIPGGYDGVNHWKCPDCNTTFKR